MCSLKSDNRLISYCQKMIFNMAAICHLEFFKFSFLARVNILSRDTDTEILSVRMSVCLSVCQSVAFRFSMKTV